MEGYSVTEAASVLGVPTERVWELLARGVLSGAPEGETGMRVFLQPRPAPAPAPVPPDPTHATANGGSHGPERGELSPFRELLTEFRSLTERYGQALLALGEARGEVASLRSRVDLLEARMDLRLPAGGATTAWEPPMPSPARSSPLPPEAHPAASATDLTPPEPSATPTDESASAATAPGPSARASEPEPETSPPEVEVEPIAAEIEVRVGRRGTPRHAVENFAEALARAEDPSIPELPGGTEAAAAMSALRAAPSDEPAADDSLPREVAPAEEVPVAEEVAVAEGVAMAEELPDADDVAAEPEPDVSPEVPPSAVKAQRTVQEEETEIGGSVEPAGASATGEPDGELSATDESGRDDADAPAVPDGPAWQDERYTAEITEPDWFEGEAFPAAEPAQETTEAAADHDAESPRADSDEGSRAEAVGAATPDSASGPTPEAESDQDGEVPHQEGAAPEQEATAGEPATASAPGDAVAEGSPRASTAQPSMLARLRPPASRESEETVLWFGRAPTSEASGESPGADEMEVASAGRSADAPEPEEPQPAGRDLGDALAALEALSRATPAPASFEPSRDERPAPPPARSPAPTKPAARAYRRLRRIFPG